MSNSKKKHKKKKLNKKVQQQKRKNVYPKNQSECAEKKSQLKSNSNSKRDFNLSRRANPAVNNANEAVNEIENKSKAKNLEKTLKVIDVSVLLVSTALLVILTVIFVAKLIGLSILPRSYQTLICISLSVIVLATVCAHFLKKFRIVVRIVTLLLCGVLIFLIVMLQSITDVFYQISDAPLPSQYVGVYVKNEDNATSLINISDHSFGILQEQDREHTDECIEELKIEISSDIEIVEYKTLSDLAIAMNNNEVNAIIVNVAYLDLLAEDEELFDFKDKIRLLWYCELDYSGTTLSYTDIGEDKESIAPFIVYICGNDSWGKLRTTGRSDVNILLAIDQKKHEILLVNTPRDYFVELSISNGQRDKLTHAGIYGIDVSVDALSRLYDVPIKHYVRLNFTGFMNIIDAMGGVTVYSDVDFKVADWHYKVGENDLSGIEALAFARERYSFSDGDLQRGKNQAALISAVVDKVTSPSILWSYQDVMKATAGTLETSMSQDELSAMIQHQISYGGKWSISTIYLNGYDSMGSCYSLPNRNVYRMIPNEESVLSASIQLKEFLGIPE